MMMIRRVVVCGACALLLTAAENAEQPLTFPREKVIGKFGRDDSSRPIKLYPVGRRPYRQDIVLDAATRLRFRVESRPATDDWRLRVIPLDGDVWEADDEDRKQNYFWSPWFQPGRVKVELEGGSGRSQLKIAIDVRSEKAVTLIASTVTHRPPEYLAITAQGGAIRQLGKSVALLWVQHPGVGPEPCTAFLIAKSLMMTAQHCIANDAEAQTATVTFDFDGSARPVAAKFRAAPFTDPKLDVAICELATDVSRPPLPLQLREPADKEFLLIVAYPSGDPEKTSRGDCRVSATAAMGASGITDFGHTCDSEGGSSGAPVFDRNNALIAVHHLGYDYRGNILLNRAIKMVCVRDSLAGAHRDDLIKQIVWR